MRGRPADFEAIGNRLGLETVQDDGGRMLLNWHGPRFPALLCLGLSLLLLFISVPIVQALHLRGFVGAAGSLWYFPVMNLVLFCIAAYLLAQKRVIAIDPAACHVRLERRSLFSRRVLIVPFSEIADVRLALDDVYSGFAVAGSSAAESFPVPSLRLISSSGASVLLDRGNRRKLAELGCRIAARLDVPLVTDLEDSARTGAARRPRESSAPRGMDGG